MKADIQTVSPTRSVLSVTAEPADVQAARAAVVREIAAGASLPGFRPGKAPARAVEKAFARRIAGETAERAVRAAYEKAVEENGLKVFELVSVDDRAEGGDGSLSFKATVDLVPSFDLPETDGIPVDDRDTKVGDDEVEEQVKQIRQSFAAYEDFDAEHAAEDGDMVKLDFEGTVDGKPLAEAVPDAASYASKKGSWCTAGSEYFIVPGLPKAILGKKAGDKGELDVEFPADFYKESLRGVKARYAWSVETGRRLVLPEMDEAFFKKLRVDGEAALRARVREGLESSAKAADRARRMNQIADHLAKAAAFELPARALERETEALLQSLLQFNMEKGVAKEDLSKEREKLTATAQERAARNLRVDFVLDALREKLAVDVSNDEFTGYLNAAVRREGLNQNQIRELSKNRAALRGYYRRALREKTLSALLAKAAPTAGLAAE